ncbi:MAG: M48 family metallopeptidase [Gammaproteobacteria bacterium]
MVRIGLVFFIVVLVSSCTTSPLNRSQVILYSDEDMERQGIAAYSEMREEIPISSNGIVIDYVQCVATGVIAGLEEADRARYQWEVTVFDEEQANAFALPGGKIGVYTGLLEVAENQDQLAAVLAHEVGHVLANHSNERASQATLGNIGLVAAQVLGASDSAISTISTASQLGLFLPFNRTQESEADTIGIIMMANAGFDPAGSIELWLNMSAQGGSRPPELLSTHPAPQTRIANLQSRLESAQLLKLAANNRGLNPACE